MLKKLFQFSSNGHGSVEAESEGVGAANGASPIAPGDEWRQPLKGPDFGPPRTDPPGAVQKSTGFEQIYQSAAVKPPRAAYSILQVAEMTNSPHLAGMAPEVRRCALLMALEAARMDPDQLLQDAMLRQRALNDYEQAEELRLKDFEGATDRENNLLQAEVERLTSQYMARIQANVDEVAAAQDRFRAWQKRKQQELQHISAAAAICVPKGAEAGSSSTSYTAVLARCGVEQAAAGAR